MICRPILFSSEKSQFRNKIKLSGFFLSLQHVFTYMQIKWYLRIFRKVHLLLPLTLQSLAKEKRPITKNKFTFSINTSSHYQPTFNITLHKVRKTINFCKFNTFKISQENIHWQLSKNYLKTI